MKDKTTLLKYSKGAMLKYGSFVIEDRSLLDYRDGLRGGPVYLNNFFHFLSGSAAPVMPPPVKAAS